MEKTSNEKLIWATAQQKKDLVDHFKCNYSSVSLALRCKRNSMLSMKIREYAVNKLHCKLVVL